MRFTRHLACLIAVVLLSSLSGSALVSAEAAAKPSRLIFVKATNPKAQKFYLKGDIVPAYAKKKVVLQRKANAGAVWKRFSTFKSTKKSRFRVRIYRTPGAKKTCWRVVVPKGGGYKSSKSGSKCLVIR